MHSREALPIGKPVIYIARGRDYLLDAPASLETDQLQKLSLNLQLVDELVLLDVACMNDPDRIDKTMRVMQSIGLPTDGKLQQWDGQDWGVYLTDTADAFALLRGDTFIQVAGWQPTDVCRVICPYGPLNVLASRLTYVREEDVNRFYKLMESVNDQSFSLASTTRRSDGKQVAVLCHVDDANSKISPLAVLTEDEADFEKIHYGFGFEQH